jgi:hypothetical protein
LDERFPEPDSLCLKFASSLFNIEVFNFDIVSFL